MTDQPTIPPAPPAATYVPAPLRTTNALAIVSLVSGILGWSVVPWLGSIIAVITGHMARAEIRRNPDTQEGDGIAIAGLVLGWAMLGLSILGVLLVLLAILFFGTAILAAVGLGGLH
jgi:hypothetical protein